jgi:hypothetical protein
MTTLTAVAALVLFAQTPPSPAAPKAVTPIVRGEKLKGLPSVALDALLADPSKYDGKDISLKGNVRQACTRKGCWMELSPSQSGAGVRITFKDYGFFVPLDSAGSTATVEGRVKVATLSEDKAKHYASEGAKVPEAKDGAVKEVQMVAVGVVLEKK